MNMYAKAEMLRGLVMTGAVARENANAIMRADRPEGARMEVLASTDGDEAEIFLYDSIDRWGGDWGVSASEFNAALNSLGDVSHIKLRINSPGGDVSEGVTMHNLLEDHSAKVTVSIDGMAASAAALLAMSGDVIRMGRGAEMMIHEPSLGQIGNAADLRHAADRLDQLGDVVADIHASRTGRTRAEFLAAMKATTWYTAEKALEAGLVTEVAPLKTNGTATASALWDKALLSKTDTATSGDESTGDGAPDESTGSAATAADLDERQRAQQVIAKAQIDAAMALSSR